MDAAAAAAPAAVDIAPRGCLAHWKTGAQSYCLACTDPAWRRWPLDPSTRTQHAVDTAARGVAEPVPRAAAATLGTAMTLPLAKEPRPAVTYHPPGVVSPIKHHRASEKAYDARLNRVYDELLVRRDPDGLAKVRAGGVRDDETLWMKVEWELRGDRVPSPGRQQRVPSGIEPGENTSQFRSSPSASSPYFQHVVPRYVRIRRPQLVPGNEEFDEADDLDVFTCPVCALTMAKRDWETGPADRSEHGACVLELTSMAQNGGAPTPEHVRWEERMRSKRRSIVLHMCIACACDTYLSRSIRDAPRRCVAARQATRCERRRSSSM